MDLLGLANYRIPQVLIHPVVGEVEEADLVGDLAQPIDLLGVASSEFCVRDDRQGAVGTVNFLSRMNCLVGKFRPSGSVLANFIQDLVVTELCVQNMLEESAEPRELSLLLRSLDGKGAGFERKSNEIVGTERPSGSSTDPLLKFEGSIVFSGAIPRCEISLAKKRGTAKEDPVAVVGCPLTSRVGTSTPSSA